MDLSILCVLKKRHIAFEKGNACGDRTGTIVKFLTSLDIFSHIDYDFQTIEYRLRELAFYSGVRIILEDHRYVEKKERTLL